MSLAPLIRTFYWLSLATGLLLGQQTPPDVAATQDAAGSVLDANPAYLIGPGDELALKFSYNADMDDTVLVRTDGKVTLRMIGDVAAAGKTPADFSAEITRLYQEYLRQPAVSAALNHSANLQVYVGGEVVNPRVVPLSGRLTAWQAILSAGGPRSSAKLKEAIWVRKTGPEEAVVRILDLKAISRGEAPDPQLQAYDVLHLSRSNIGAANLVVEQFVNGLVPRTIVFPYNLNTNFRVE